MLKHYDHDPAVVSAVRAEYRVRRTRLHRLLIVWLGYGTLILWTGFMAWELAPYLLVGGMIVFVLATRRVWRCPNCNASLGRMLRQDFCSRCNIPLEDEASSLADATAGTRRKAPS